MRFEQLVHELHDYFTAYDKMSLWGTDHLSVMALSVVLIIGIPWIARRYLTPPRQRELGVVVGLVTAGGYVVWVALEILAGTFDLKRHLPVHFCHFAALMAPLVLAFGSYRVYEILYFWAFSGVLQAVLTPATIGAFPHCDFFRFWIIHTGILLSVVYATAVYGMRPTASSLVRAFVALVVFFLCAIPVNVAFDANYFWLCGKPARPTLLDYLGPWPLYMFPVALIALAQFAVALMPIYVLRRFGRMEESDDPRLRASRRVTSY
jgi:hypothetical integral membrane protein (TIGR02206 family)